MSCNSLLSVIVPVYNAEQYLDRCISSILNQTFRNIEVILVDDGSTDLSPMICVEWAKKDERVRVFHKKNGGQASARNYGLARANGELITFIDDDDWIEPEMYERLISLCVSNDADITGCATLTERQDGISYNTYCDMHDGVLEKDVCICNVLRQDSHAWGTVWNKIFKRKLWDNVLFPEGKQLEDYVVIVKIFEMANKIYFCNSPYYHYNFRKGSQSKRGFHEGLLTAFDSANEIRVYLNEVDDNKLVLDAADIFVYRVYASVLWELHRSDYPDKSKLIQEYRMAAWNAFKRYLSTKGKRVDDIKLTIKLILAFYDK